MTRCSACVENLLESSQLACGWSPDDEACAARTTGRRVARQPRSMTRETTEQDMAVLQYGGRIVGAKKGALIGPTIWCSPFVVEDEPSSGSDPELFQQRGENERLAPTRHQCLSEAATCPLHRTRRGETEQRCNGCGRSHAATLELLGVQHAATARQDAWTRESEQRHPVLQRLPAGAEHFRPDRPHVEPIAVPHAMHN